MATQAEQPPVREPSRLRQAIRAGYRDEAGTLPDEHEERAPLYRVVTFLNPALTFDYWAPEADDPTTDLATWIQEEMDRRIANFKSGD